MGKPGEALANLENPSRTWPQRTESSFFRWLKILPSYQKLTMFKYETFQQKLVSNFNSKNEMVIKNKNSFKFKILFCNNFTAMLNIAWWFCFLLCPFLEECLRIKTFSVYLNVTDLRGKLYPLSEITFVPVKNKLSLAANFWTSSQHLSLLLS